MNKVLKYNLDSAKKHGWNPEWFGAEKFDDELISKIKDFQQDCKIKADGMAGPSTLRRKETEMMSQDFTPVKRRKRSGEKFIVYNGKKFPIAWEKVILWDDHGGLKAKEGCYYDWSKRPARAPMQFVNHWDATLSSEACARIINKRGLSMHFLIDNDGTIYQMLDIQHVAWQAGAKSWNNAGIGVEISNAFYLKYQDWYKKKGFGERPVVVSEVNGRPVGPHLDFYPIQLQALAALWAAIHDSVGIEMQVCETKGVDDDCRQLNFNGFINHYNLTANKIDCSSLDMNKVLEEAKKFSQNF
jgi:hypothetical protein